MDLKWNKIDFKNNQIKIDVNLLYSKDIGIYEDTPKTETSIKDIKIPPRIMKLVKTLATENKKNILKLGNKWTNSGYLLTQENGLPMHPGSITDYCSKFRTKYNKIIQKVSSLKI